MGGTCSTFLSSVHFLWSPDFRFTFARGVVSLSQKRRNTFHNDNMTTITMRIFLGIFLIFTQLKCNYSFSISRNIQNIKIQSAATKTTLWGNPKGRAWAKGDLSDKDIFEDADTPEADGSLKKKDKVKLEPETVFFEGAPSPSELILPGLSVLTVIGIVPFVSALSRQAWVRYKFTSRRISIQSGVGGKTTTEIIYPDIEEIRYVYRAFGAAGDMVLFLKDGAKVEMRFVPDFSRVYTYILSKCDAECKEKSMRLTIKEDIPQDIPN